MIIICFNLVLNMLETFHRSLWESQVCPNAISLLSVGKWSPYSSCCPCACNPSPPVSWLPWALHCALPSCPMKAALTSARIHLEELTVGSQQWITTLYQESSSSLLYHTLMSTKMHSNLCGKIVCACVLYIIYIHVCIYVCIYVCVVYIYIYNAFKYTHRLT